MVLEGVDKYSNLFGTVYVPPAPVPPGAPAAAGVPLSPFLLQLHGAAVRLSSQLHFVAAL